MTHPDMTHREEALRLWREAGEAAASLAEDQGLPLAVGRSPTSDELTAGVDDVLTPDERAAAWTQGWDSYVLAVRS